MGRREDGRTPPLEEGLERWSNLTLNPKPSSSPVNRNYITDRWLKLGPPWAPRQIVENVVLEGVVSESVVLESVVLESVVLESVVLEGVVLENVVLEGIVLESVVLV